MFLFLGFDPFEECNKGLANLLATEAKAYSQSSNEPNGLNPSSWQNPPSDPFAQLNKNVNPNQQYSLFGDSGAGLKSLISSMCNF